ncbi:unnamed protein product [Cladocopium goreaui]|uniref:Uncharacterized protein n=1 Tax=Cladocopium goreaui TaxID=2562237 RepID=A0A9P1BTX9_9DINO|nr:unnamed protein product [Cladocopium goreaui]
MYCCTIPTAWPGLSRSSIGPRHTSRKHPVTSKGLAKQSICDCSPTSEVNTIKAANFAHLNDLSLLHLVLRRHYVPISCQETQEFTISIASFSRCFCEDVVQCSLKFFFIMDCQVSLSFSRDCFGT